LNFMMGDSSRKDLSALGEHQRGVRGMTMGMYQRQKRDSSIAVHGSSK
jgi:hypothetical protein